MQPNVFLDIWHQSLHKTVNLSQNVLLNFTGYNFDTISSPAISFYLKFDSRTKVSEHHKLNYEVYKVCYVLNNKINV